MADEIPDLNEIMEENYEDYEARYADDFDMMDGVEEPDDIDFEAVVTKKHRVSAEDIDKSYLKTDSKFQFSTTLSGAASTKRKCADLSDEEELQYSDEEETNYAENNNQLHDEKKSGNHIQVKGLPPKKLKLNDAAEKNEELYSDIKIDELLNELKEKPSDYSISKDQFSSVKRVFKRPVLDVETFNITSTDGDRVYVKLYEDQPELDELAFHWRGSSSESGLNLLPQPFEQLKNEVLQKRDEKSLHARQNANHNRKEKERAGNIPENVQKMELWVEKYHPKFYSELLSDDGTNRVLLKWLKLWDQIVFDKKAGDNKKSSKNAIASNKYKGQNNEKGKFVKNNYYNIEDDLIVDRKGRPKFKIALLCGNPGLGKTTLAHVISKHAGYNVVEMNASDDRSPELFINKIESTTQMQSVFGISKKPNCLVIDEIDGAPAPAIKILIDLAKRTEEANMNKKVKKKKKEFILNRPIICICNDEYVPALRQLRQVAFLLKFPPTLSSRLASRLLIISQMEQLRIDMGCLLQLADKTENDIRSCLNTLQFINEKSRDVTPDEIFKLDIGQKDMKKGVKVILNDVFKLPKSKKKHFSKMSNNLRNEMNSKTSSSARFYNMLHLVSGNSETEKLSQGLFDYYLHAKTKDPYMESINLGTEWLQFMDFVQKRINQTQNYVLFRYAPFLPVAFHMYFAKASAPKFPYCNDAYENHIKETQNKQTVNLLLSGIKPGVRRYIPDKICILDLIPFIYFIAIPSLRPVNTQLYSESEKQILSSLIHTMISYNLTYRQERNKEGQYTYLLEPNIEELIAFTGLPQHKHLPYATKQLIAREVDLEKMRIAETLLKASETPNTSSSEKPKDSTAADIIKKQKIIPKAFRNARDAPQLDFFGREPQPVVKKMNNANTAKQQESNRKKMLLDTNVWFKFNEGYTNAVRRTVKVHEFL